VGNRFLRGNTASFELNFQPFQFHRECCGANPTLSGGVSASADGGLLLEMTIPIPAYPAVQIVLGAAGNVNLEVRSTPCQEIDPQMTLRGRGSLALNVEVGDVKSNVGIRPLSIKGTVDISGSAGGPGFCVKNIKVDGEAEASFLEISIGSFRIKGLSYNFNLGTLSTSPDNVCYPDITDTIKKLAIEGVYRVTPKP
jgi:hypothetical protein